MDAEAVVALLQVARVVGSTDAPAHRDHDDLGGPERIDIVPEVDPAADPERVAVARAELQRVRRLVSAREWRAVELVYQEGRTLRDAGRLMGICRERVRQLMLDVTRAVHGRPRLHQEDQWKRAERNRRAMLSAKQGSGTLEST